MHRLIYIIEMKKGAKTVKNLVFENYVREYGDSLSRLCFSLCRNEQDAYDLYQETWLKAFASFDNTEVRNFEKWLYTICVNKFKDTYRKKLRSPSEIQFETNEHKDAFMSALSYEEKYDIDDYSELYSALEKLPDKLKTVISLRYFSELSCNDISEVLGISVTAVTTRLSRAIKALAKEMNSVKEMVK